MTDWSHQDMGVHLSVFSRKARVVFVVAPQVAKHKQKRDTLPSIEFRKASHRLEIELIVWSGPKLCTSVDLENAVNRIFSCKYRLRYSRGRALQNLARFARF